MDLSFVAEIVERKSAGYSGPTSLDASDPGDRLERSISDLIEGARGRLPAAALFSLRAVLCGAVAELRRHHDMHAAT